MRISTPGVPGGEEALLLVGEVLVEGLAGDPGAAHHVGHRGGGVALLRHGLGDRRQHAPALRGEHLLACEAVRAARELRDHVVRGERSRVPHSGKRKRTAAPESAPLRRLGGRRGRAYRLRGRGPARWSRRGGPRRSPRSPGAACGRRRPARRAEAGGGGGPAGDATGGARAGRRGPLQRPRAGGAGRARRGVPAPPDACAGPGDRRSRRARVRRGRPGGRARREAVPRRRHPGGGRARGEPRDGRLDGQAGRGHRRRGRAGPAAAGRHRARPRPALRAGQPRPRARCSGRSSPTCWRSTSARTPSA